MYPTIQNASTVAGMIGTLYNLHQVIQNGDISTLDNMVLYAFLIQFFFKFVVAFNYTSKVNPPKWKTDCLVSIVVMLVLCFVMYLKKNGYVHCEKNRSCIQKEGSEKPVVVKQPTKMEYYYLASAIAVSVIAFIVST